MMVLSWGDSCCWKLTFRVCFHKHVDVLFSAGMATYVPHLSLTRLSVPPPPPRIRRRMKEYLPLMLQGLQTTTSSRTTHDRQQQRGSVYHSNDNVGTGGVHYPSQPEGVQ